MTRRVQPTKSLCNAIVARWPCGAVRVENASETAWASATFSGARHCLAFFVPSAFAQDDGGALLTGLCCEEFDIPGNIVADIMVTKKAAFADGLFFTIEALTVEAA
jgi:hypothetical protein